MVRRVLPVASTVCQRPKMPDSPLSELRGKRRITVPLDAGRAPTLAAAAEVVLGDDPHGGELQVLIAKRHGAGDPSIPELRTLHRWRQGKRTFPLVTVIRPDTEEPGTIRDVSAATGAETNQPSLLTDRGDEASFRQRWLSGQGGFSEESATGEPSWVLVLGPDLEVAPARLPEEQAARMLQAALDEPSAVSARRRIVGLLKQSAGTGDDTGTRPGMNNAGLFSRHYLVRSLPGEARWTAARRRARLLLDRRGMDLIRGLGFRIGDRFDQALVLLGKNSGQRAVAVLLERTETFEAGSGRLGMSPAAYGLDRASKRGAEWLILLRGDQIRLYATKPGTGVGSRSPVDTWFQLDLAALAPEDAGYLDLVFSAAALSPEGAVANLLARSRQFATDLGDRLRQRVYERVIPGLAVGVAEALDRLPGREGSGDLSYAYRLSLRIFFRLLFQAYAEDRGLLPYGRNDRFDLHSLKRLAVTLSSSDRPAATFDAGATTLWRDLQTIWKAIDKGDRGLDVPAYNGGLFDADPGFRREGTDLADIELGDDCIGPALRDLLVDETPDGDVGPVDFRSLSVREFGTIYEGLLESELSRADMDLTIDKKNVYVPARPKDEVVVPKGDVYFHNRSGERKATGSYFTPEFAVEHLLDHALEPVLAEHLKRVEKLHDRGDHASAAEAFWDFRVADISMGSGHFLIAAVDRIERGMRRFLADRPLASVNDELRRLERKAREALGSPGDRRRDGPELEPSTLLRRQIARRCIHGVDVNETAVELARVAAWIHTFVPGLPMSTLDHNLVRGDSLTGIGTVDEALDVLDPDRGTAQGSLFSQPIEEAMAEAAEALGEVAAAQEADTAEVLRNREALEDAKARAVPARRLFDAAVAVRLGVAETKAVGDVEAIARIADRPEVEGEIERLQPVHMPLRFPQVFERESPGFDVLIGNPPWEEATVEELGFWTARFPGLKALRQQEQIPRIQQIRQDRPDLVTHLDNEVSRAQRLRNALHAGPYPGMGTGDPDLYKAFCWRFWHVVREDGAFGVVLPGSALTTKGSANWRKAVLKGGAFSDLTLLANRNEWVFEIDPSYTIGLVTARKGRDHSGVLRLRGPFDDLASYRRGAKATATEILVEEFLTWTKTASIPAVPSDEALRVFRRMCAHPRLDFASENQPEPARTSGLVSTWRARPATEFHATNDKRFFRLDVPAIDVSDRGASLTRPTASDTKDGPSLWPVYGGRSFHFWKPDTGEYYAWADPGRIVKVLQKKRLRGQRTSTSPFREFSHEWAADSATLPCLHPRVVFRDIAAAARPRAVIAALIPGERVITNKGPYLLLPLGTEADEAFLVGILSSMVLDWFARRLVKLNLSFFIFNALPIPRPEFDDRDPSSPGIRLRTRVIEIAGRLATAEPDHPGFREWAAAVGVDAGSVRSEAEKNDLIEELDAVVALLYGLDDADLTVIYDTFHTGADYSDRCRRVIEHARAWRNRLGFSVGDSGSGDTP